MEEGSGKGGRWEEEGSRGEEGGGMKGGREGVRPQGGLR